MKKIPSIEILQLSYEILPEGISYSSSLDSNETVIGTYPPGSKENLYVHQHQTDYVQVVRGKLIWVILSDGKYQYIPLSEEDSFVVKVPPKVVHGGFNPYDQTCIFVNAIVLHKPHKPVYKPITPPFPYDIEKALSSQVPKDLKRVHPTFVMSKDAY